MGKMIGLKTRVALLGLILCGCSADIEVNTPKAGEGAEAQKAPAPEVGKREPTTEELQRAELEAKRDAIAASFSKTNAAPLYVTNPAAWFEETNEQMKFTRDKLLEAQAQISTIYGKYDRQIRAGGDKSKGYLDLLDKAEKARAEGKSKGWPVAFDQWVVDDEEALDAKIAEINTAMEKNRVLSVEDTAMHNASRDRLRRARELLVKFDDAYAQFVRTWDKWKMDKTLMIPDALQEEVNKALDITQIFINEWNRVK